MSPIAPRLRLRVAVLVASFASAGLPAAAADTQPVPVAMYADKGAAGKGPKMMEETLNANGYTVTRVDAADIRAGKLKDYKVLIMPGGSSGTEGRTLAAEGRDKVKEFIRDGGVYAGVCAGCFLASSEYTWSLHVLPATVVDRANSYRGRANLKLELTAAGKEWFGRSDPEVTTVYHNGPVLKALPGAEDKLIPLAIYREEIVRKGAEAGLMVGTPAIAAARYGSGWAVGISPHPEQTEGLRELLPAALRWALGHPADTASTPAK